VFFFFFFLEKIFFNNLCIFGNNKQQMKAKLQEELPIQSRAKEEERKNTPVCLFSS